jgi:DNA polymerase-3 subunit delta'
MTQRIIVSDDLDRTLEEVKAQLQGSRIVLFDKEDFLVGDASDVIKEAYLTSDTTKYLIIKAHKFNTASQNALLKILEEPPHNVVFILITRHKSSLLPTVRSRLPIEKDGDFSEIIELDINLQKIDLQFIYDFIQENKRMSRDEAKVFIQSLLVKQLNEGNRLSDSTLALFGDAIKLLTLNSNVQTVLLNLLLSVYIHETL